MILKPFQHDCERCIWVGWVRMDNRWGNMYFCPRSDLSTDNRDVGSVVVRFSDDGPDYWSHPVWKESKPTDHYVPAGLCTDVTYGERDE